jgi:hypothetical protein
MPAIMLRRSTHRYGGVPADGEPILIEPGFALAAAISSATVFGANDGLASSTSGMLLTVVMAVVSRAKS